LAEVVWTDAAIGDLERIADYIEAFSPLAAQRMAVRLIAAASSLELAPERGRSIGDGRRELVVITPYVVRYRIEGGRVLVLEIRHAAREG
jgi:plasmid stabilization system protein ParE